MTLTDHAHIPESGDIVIRGDRAVAATKDGWRETDAIFPEWRVCFKVFPMGSARVSADNLTHEEAEVVVKNLMRSSCGDYEVWIERRMRTPWTKEVTDE